MSQAQQDIAAERSRQKYLAHGGVATDEFDKGNSQNDWVGFITAYNGRAADKVTRNVGNGNLSFRENMIRVGALALAAIEAFDEGLCPDSEGFER